MKIGWLSITFDRVWWRWMWRTEFCGIFRNKDGVKPGRWGFYVGGIEFGSRQPGNWFGAFLKRIGLWPW